MNGANKSMLSLDEILFEPEQHTYSYYGKQFDSVTQIIRKAGLGEDFSAVPPDRMEYARQRGRLVHAACHYYDEGDLKMDSIDPAIRGYVEAYVSFREDCKIKPIAIEQKLLNTSIPLAGTPDLICWLRGERCVIDRKTSQIMHKSMGMQTAGYKILWNSRYPCQPIKTRYGLRVEKTGKYKLIPHNDLDDTLAFWDAMEYAKAQNKMGRWIVKYGHR